MTVSSRKLPAATSPQRCGTQPPAPETYQRVAEVLEQKAREAPDAEVREALPTRVVDVFVHVIRKGEGEVNGDVPQEQIDQQIQVLNQCFGGSGFEFELKDTQRVDEPRWFEVSPGSEEEAEMKGALHQGDSTTLNLYTARPGHNLLGWSSFPWDAANQPKNDGVVIHNGTLPGGPVATFSLGKTVVHEVGHFLGLKHTWNQAQDGWTSKPATFDQAGGGTLPPSGDDVSDTPVHAVPNFGTPPETTDTSPQEPGNDPVHNYMNYGDDIHLTEFTPGQIDRAHALWETFREPGFAPASVVVGTHPHLKIPDRTSVESTLEVIEPLTMGNLEVTLDVEHTWKRDLRITLIAPSGESVVLQDRTGGFWNDVKGTVSVSSLAGEQAQGTWTLKVEDVAGRNEGTLHSWNLNIQGTRPSQ